MRYAVLALLLLVGCSEDTSQGGVEDSATKEAAQPVFELTAEEVKQNRVDSLYDYYLGFTIEEVDPDGPVKDSVVKYVYKRNEDIYRRLVALMFELGLKDVEAYGVLTIREAASDSMMNAYNIELGGGGRFKKWMRENSALYKDDP